MTGYLIAEEGPLVGLIVRLEDKEEWLLGRDPDAVSILLEDPMVSRRHAICRLTPEGYILENLSSVNPVTQNGRVVTESVLLREGDILQIGSTFFRFSEKLGPSTAHEMKRDPFMEPLLLEGTENLSTVRVEEGGEARWLLKVVSGPNSGAEFALHKGATYILGKDPNLCDIVFQDLSVSRQHAKLVTDAQDRLFIEDLDSRNGTLVGSEVALGLKELLSQDVVTLGTTSFLAIDTTSSGETIFSPAALPLRAEEEFTPSEPAHVEAPPQDWKETVIPKRHLIGAGLIGLCLLGAIAGMMALFHSEPIAVHKVDEPALIKETLKSYNDVQYVYNESSGKILLVGHVLTSVDKQELLYRVRALSFIASIEDAIIIDEYVWENINALLMTNPDWVGVSLYSPTAGKFVLRGYLGSLNEFQTLNDYMNLNFPYLDRLDNQVVIETNLEAQIQSILIAKGFGGVSFQLSNGEVVLAGRVDHKQVDTFTDIVDTLKGLHGIRIVKNFVIFTTVDTSRVDVSSQYTVSGYSKKDDTTQFVVINGKILSIGDVVDGMHITEIMPSTVLLEKDGVKFRINYNLQ
jgi:type III secretion system YscD/HrpQ family protein